MSATGSETADRGPAAAAARPQDAAAATVHHGRSFKLRFASQREPGRSYVSLVKPLSLPATVTDKFYSRGSARAGDAAAERRALARLQDMFRRGPRDRLPAPLTESHEYGWWSEHSGDAWRRDARLDHRLRDSARLKGRLLVLDAELRRT